MTRVLALFACLLAGCASVPEDPFTGAEQAMQEDDLLTALVAYDSVPVMHPRYPDARAGASEIERRLRRAHELLLEGLVRRGEWRDREALDCLRRAVETWPDLPGAAALIAATEQRMGLFVVSNPRRSSEVMPPTGVASTAPRGEQPHPVAGQVDPSLVSAGAEGAADPISSALAAIEGRLGRGEFELAVVELLELARQFPDEQRVRMRLGRVLHQRALMRYGQGALVAAIEDWERVLTVDPRNEVVPELLAKARSELVPATPR